MQKTKNTVQFKNLPAEDDHHQIDRLPRSSVYTSENTDDMLGDGMEVWLWVSFFIYKCFIWNNTN